MPASACALITDLIFSTRIAAAAQSAGVPLRIIRTAAALNVSDRDAPSILFVDLDLSGADPIAAIQAARTLPHPPQIVAFGSHVQTDLLAAARAAGADQVLPRSAFVARLDELLGSA